MPIILQANNFSINGVGGVLDSRNPGGAAINAPPVWGSIPLQTVSPGASVFIGGYVSDANGDSIVITRTGGTAPAGVIVSNGGYVTVPAITPPQRYTLSLLANDGRGGTASVTIDLDVSATVAAFNFAEIPEIVFVRGVDETDELGIYVLDPSNRVAPGDLWWSEDRRLRRHADLGGGDWSTATPVSVVGTLPAGVTFNSSTCQLTYTHSGSLMTPSDRQRIRLSANGVLSDEFYVSVLKPTVVWGYGAEAVASGYGVPWGDPNLGHTWAANVRPRFTGNSTSWETTPNVVYWLGGLYDGAANLITTPTTSWNLYIVGATGANRTRVAEGGPVMHTTPRVVVKRIDGVDSGFNFEMGARVALFNELTGIVVDIYGAYSQGSITDLLTNYQSINGESLFEQDMAATYAEDPDAHYPALARLFVSNVRLANRGQSDIDHHMYVHGRGNSLLAVNNVKVGGATGPCSGIKCTIRYARVRNSWISPVADYEELASNPDRIGKLIDAAACADIVIYNNDLIGAYSAPPSGADLGGVQDGLIYFRNRNSRAGNDEPASPCNAFYLNSYNGVAPVDWLTNFRAWKRGYVSPVLNGWSGSPETYWSNAFFDAVQALPISDPSNPYTFKKYVSYNKFTWINEAGMPRQSAFRDDGLRHQFTLVTSGPEYRMSIPTNWIDRSVTFLANNIFTGWTPADVAYTQTYLGDTNRGMRWFDLNWTGDLLIDGYVGPTDADHSHIHLLPSRTGAASRSNDPRTVVFVGGDSGPHPEAAVAVDANGVPLTQPAYVSMPPWFRI